MRIAGKPPTLHYSLGENDTVTVGVQRGKRRVLTRTTPAPKGSRTLKLGTPRDAAIR